MELTGHIPEPDEIIQNDCFEFRILEMNGKKIAKIQINIITPEFPDDNDEAE